jgi:hypothetical protein
MYSATSSLGCSKSKNVFFYFELRSSFFLDSRADLRNCDALCAAAVEVEHPEAGRAGHDLVADEAGLRCSEGRARHAVSEMGRPQVSNLTSSKFRQKSFYRGIGVQNFILKNASKKLVRKWTKI